jgi:hypothetical protein
MTSNKTEQNDKSTDWIRNIGWKWAILLILLAVWLVSPMFRSVQIESFTASLSSLANAAHNGNLAGDDPTYPLRISILYLMRFGVIQLLQALQEVSGTVGDWQFRVLMIGSLLVITSATCVIARRWAKVAIPASIAAILLTTGIVDSSFCFNDNLVSAAFVTVGLSLISPNRGW